MPFIIIIIHPHPLPALRTARLPLIYRRSSRHSHDNSAPPLPVPSQVPGSQHSHDGRSCAQRPNRLPKLLHALFLAALPRGLVRFAALAPRLAARWQQLLVLVLLQQLVDCTPEAREVRQRCGHL